MMPHVEAYIPQSRIEPVVMQPSQSEWEFGGSIFQFGSMEEMLSAAQQPIGEVGEVKLEPSLVIEDDFSRAQRIISANLGAFTQLQSSIMMRAQQLQIACHPHNSSMTTMTSPMSNLGNSEFTSGAFLGNLGGEKQTHSTEQHGHCGSCGADLKGGKCPKCL